MKLSRRALFKYSLRAVVGSSLVAFGGYYYTTGIETTWLAVEQVTIPLKQLPPALEGFRLVLMSDFHLYPYTRLEVVQEAVALANSLKPDLIVLAGDYVLESADAIDDLAPVLAGLNAAHGVFAILGNHDLWTNGTTVLNGLERAGVPVLYNSGIALGTGTGMLYLAGLDDGWSGQPDLERALAQRPADAPTILLMHEPDFADQFAQDGRVVLQLSGHTHGGQVRLPGIGALVLPPYGRMYDQGLFQVGDMWLYTTRGIGVIGPPLRLNCRPEVTEITLVSGHGPE